MLEATYTISDEELLKAVRSYIEVESREKRVPWLLKLFMGKGRPKYSWQVWLSNNWPTKEIPKERRWSTLMVNEMEKFTSDAIVEEMMNKMKQEKL